MTDENKKSEAIDKILHTLETDITVQIRETRNDMINEEKTDDIIYEMQKIIIGMMYTNNRMNKFVNECYDKIKGMTIANPSIKIELVK